MEKQDMLPAAWAGREFPDDAVRGNYFAIHDLTGLPDYLDGFPEFFEARQQSMAARLRTLLGGVLHAEDTQAEPALIPSIGDSPEHVAAA